MITIVKVPRINTNDAAVEVVGWEVEDGAFVEKGREIVVVETSKAAVTLEAETEGYIRQLARRGSLVLDGAPLCYLATSPDELPEPLPEGPQPGDVSLDAPLAVAERKEMTRRSYSVTRFSRDAHTLMLHRGLSPEDFQGCGLVTAQIIKEMSGATPGQEQSLADQTRQDLISKQPTRTERILASKREEIRCLAAGNSGSITSTLSVYFDSASIRNRLRNDNDFLDASIQPLVIYEVARLLKQWPQFTAYFENETIYFYDRVDLGIAVDLGKGIKVVTIAEADRLSPIEIFEKTLDIGLRYLENRLLPEELVGSTLTITDLSGFDVLYFRPLINGKQSAIIGLGGDSTRPGHPSSINLTFDHRVATGRDVAMFLNELRTRLLSYSLCEPPGRISSSEQSVNAPLRCDTCGIDQGAYYAEFGRDAYMLAYFREDGTMGRVCHRCSTGFSG
jgi:pyruvate/2-oxoglutarate dehydrogenase complex dihydrolipoamide acyltransferase (E2) component